MASLTVRLPALLVAEIEAEALNRGIQKSEVVRERLARPAAPVERRTAFDAIADLVGSVEGLPSGIAAHRKAYLKKTGYGRKRAR